MDVKPVGEAQEVFQADYIQKKRHRRVSKLKPICASEREKGTNFVTFFCSEFSNIFPKLSYFPLIFLILICRLSLSFPQMFSGYCDISSSDAHVLKQFNYFKDIQYMLLNNTLTQHTK